MDSVRLLLSAANELKMYIDRENERLKSKVNCDDLDPPEYHDYQTCYELAQLAKTIKVNYDTK
jgi:hypothetical protein